VVHAGAALLREVVLVHERCRRRRMGWLSRHSVGWRLSEAQRGVVDKAAAGTREAW